MYFAHVLEFMVKTVHINSCIKNASRQRGRIRWRDRIGPVSGRVSLQYQSGGLMPEERWEFPEQIPPSEKSSGFWCLLRWHHAGVKSVPPQMHTQVL